MKNVRSGGPASRKLAAMMTVRCYLAPSSIEGLGVFCHEPIRKGDVVWRFDDRFDQKLPRALVEAADPVMREFLERYGSDHLDHPEFLFLDADEGRFMNHADAPNTDFKGADFGIALRDIPAGEELTCDYREFTFGELHMQPSRHRVAALAAE